MGNGNAHAPVQVPTLRDHRLRRGFQAHVALKHSHVPVVVSCCIPRRCRSVRVHLRLLFLMHMWLYVLLTCSPALHVAGG